MIFFLSFSKQYADEKKKRNTREWDHIKCVKKLGSEAKTKVEKRALFLLPVNSLAKK